MSTNRRLKNLKHHTQSIGNGLYLGGTIVVFQWLRKLTQARHDYFDERQNDGFVILGQRFTHIRLFDRVVRERAVSGKQHVGELRQTETPFEQFVHDEYGWYPQEVAEDHGQRRRRSSSARQWSTGTKGSWKNGSRNVVGESRTSHHKRRS